MSAVWNEGQRNKKRNGGKENKVERNKKRKEKRKLNELKDG